MPADISARVGLEGGQKFKEDLKTLTAQSKMLSSEMKVVTSSFDKNTTAEEKAAKTSEVLNKQIKVQEDRVKLLSEQLENSRDKYGDNSKQTYEWQQKVNDAQTALNKMRNQLNEANSTLDSNEKEMKEVKTATEEAGKSAVSFGDLVKANVVSDAITKGFETLKNVAKEAAKAFKDLTIGTASYADDILTASTVTGISTKALQELTYMAELVDTDVSTITGSMTKMVRTMSSAQDGSKTATESFKKLGVAFQNSDGSLRDSEEVFYDIITALGNMTNETERDALAMEVFGKSAKELNPLIATGAEGIAEFRKEAEEMGYVLSDEQLDALGKVDDAYQRWQRTVEMVKNTIGAALAPTMEALLSQMREWVNGIDWKEVGEVIGGVFTDLGERIKNIDLAEAIKNVADGVSSFVRFIGNINFEKIGTSIGTVANLFKNHGKTIKLAIVGIGTAFAGLKIASLISSISGVGLAFGSVAAPIGIAVAAITGITAVIQNWGAITETAKNLWNNAKEAIVTTFTSLKEGIVNKYNEIKTNVTEIGEKVKQGFVDTFEGVKKGIGEKMSAIKTAISESDAFKSITDAVSKAYNWGKDLIQGMANGIKDNQGILEGAASGAANGVSKYLHFSKPDVGPLATYDTWMPDFMKGLAQGIKENSYLVDDAISQVASSLVLQGQGDTNTTSFGNIVFNVNIEDGASLDRSTVDDFLSEVETGLINIMQKGKAVYD